MDNVFAKMMRNYPLASRSVLEQDYRSNAMIVAAWNAVIERNTLWEQKQAVSVLRRRGAYLDC